MSPFIQTSINDLPEIPYSEIMVERILGEGNFGTVSLASTYLGVMCKDSFGLKQTGKDDLLH